MMDRLDFYGMFNRIDRESVFHQLSLFIIKELIENKPEYLIATENPHSHAHYLVYEICDFLNLKLAKFNSWGLISPLLFIQDMNSLEKTKIEFNHKSILKNKVISELEEYMNNLSKRNYNDNYFPNYIIKQNYSYFNRSFSKLIKEIIYMLKLEVFQIRMNFSKKYYKINPYKVNFFSRKFIRKRKKETLLRQHNLNLRSFNKDSEFIYFPLHFEPERTTNPDGGDFHDQFLALITLRSFVPKNIKIYVKEHPSQFLLSNRGILGRSPIFYELINKLNNVFLIDIKSDNFTLIKNSNFVATITGTVAIEASIIGKQSLIFGDAWFKGFPNVFEWNDRLIYDDIVNSDIKDNLLIKNYLSELMDKYCVPGCINPSTANYFKRFLDKEFVREEKKGVISIMEKFLDL